MQFNNPNLISSFSFRKACIFEHFIGAYFWHGIAYNIHGAATFICNHIISAQSLGNDLDGLILETMFYNKIFRSNDTTSGSILRLQYATCTDSAADKDTYRGRATHELCEIICDLRSIHDLLNTPAITKLGVGIVYRVLVVLWC